MKVKKTTAYPKGIQKIEQGTSSIFTASGGMDTNNQEAVIVWISCRLSVLLSLKRTSYIKT